MRARLLIAGTGLALATLFAPAAVADEAVLNIINQATLAEYQTYLRVLTGVDPIPGSNPPVFITNRYSYGNENRIAGQWIYDHFDSLGLNVSLHEFDPSYGPSVIGELPGTTRPDDIYIVCGHFDTYQRSNQYDAPGCDDNASGTCTAMLAARILSQYEFEGTIRFIAFSGEEQWMVGSLAYAAEARARGENIVAAINLDMILHPSFDNQPDPDYDIDIEGDPPSLWLSQHMAEQFAAYTPIDFEIHTDPDLVSDHWAFWQHGYNAIGLCENTAPEIWGGSNNSYHRNTDTIDNPHWDWDFALHTIRGGMAGLITLAGLVSCDACDMNCDGQVDSLDIEPFLDMLFAGAEPCEHCTGDVNGDGTIDALDIEPFIDCLFP